MRAVCSACFGPPEDEACPGTQVSALFSVPFQPLIALPNGPFPCSLPHPSQVPPKLLAVLLNPSLNPFLQRFTPGPPTGRPRPISAPPQRFSASP